MQRMAGRGHRPLSMRRGSIFNHLANYGAVADSAKCCERNKVRQWNRQVWGMVAWGSVSQGVRKRLYGAIDKELGGEHSSLEEHQVLLGEYLNLAFSKERTEVCMSGRRGAQKIRKARGI